MITQVLFCDEESCGSQSRDNTDTHRDVTKGWLGVKLGERHAEIHVLNGVTTEKHACSLGCATKMVERHLAKMMEGTSKVAADGPPESGDLLANTFG